MLFSGKMIITGFKGTLPTDPAVIQLKEKIDSQAVGGVILFKRNIVNKNQLKTLVNY